MCEIPFVRVQLHILGKCALCAMWWWDTEQVQQRRRLAPHRHAAESVYQPVCVCVFVSSVCPAWASPAWRWKGDSQRFLVLAHRTQIRFSAEEKPAPFIPGKRVFERKGWMKRQRARKTSSAASFRNVTELIDKSMKLQFFPRGPSAICFLFQICKKHHLKEPLESHLT